eukprot:TRINITY_DN65437_c0_g1_i1.p1 TRINITY_DN65437_c0_g1~~TRINITY_DN65437_c0_g1_i1.p1  ORF type:complete len:2269 (+),score=529.06 TRINITY_DN65437_c0_g1_i1:427-6807(+)
MTHWELQRHYADDFREDRWHPRTWAFDAAVLFVDISGFTTLCTRLDIDKLQEHINSYFTAIINVVTSSGGDVLRFMGDAVICAWALASVEAAPEAGGHSVRSGRHRDHGTPGRHGRPYEHHPENTLAMATRMACACALELVEEYSTYNIPELGETLSIHAGVSAGPLRGFLVGTAAQWEFLVAGKCVPEMYAAAGSAGPGEAVCAAEAWPLVASCFRGSPRDDSGNMRLLQSDSSPAGLLWGVCDTPMPRGSPTATCRSAKSSASSDANINAEFARCLLYPELLRLQRRGQTSKVFDQEWHIKALQGGVHKVARDNIEQNVSQHGEKRQVLVAFALIGGLENSMKGEATVQQQQLVQECLGTALDIIEMHGGQLRQFILDDKGTVMIWTFGLRGSSFEDNASRGLTSAFEIGDSLHVLGLSAHIGITSGLAFCGRVGALYRCEYTVMGPSVNLAARLMCMCEREGVSILCDDRLQGELVQRHSEDFTFKELRPVKVKGYGELVTIFNPQRVYSMMKTLSVERQHGTLRGRSRELAILRKRVETVVHDGGFNLTFVTGEPGIGKTSLLMGLAMETFQNGHSSQACTVAYVEAVDKRGGGDKSFAAWLPVLRTLLREQTQVPSDQIDLDAVKVMLPPSLQDNMTSESEMLLSALTRDEVSVYTSDSLSENDDFDLELLVSLLVHLAGLQPCAIVVDAAEHLSTVGWQVLTTLADARPANTAVVVASRPSRTAMRNGPERDMYDKLMKNDTAQHLEVGPLSAQAIRVVLGEFLDAREEEVSMDLACRVHKWCGGNPLFLVAVRSHFASVQEELKNDPSPRTLDSILEEILSTLPSTVNESVLAQLDKLQLRHQIILKTAAAIGNRFQLSVLSAVYPGPASDVNMCLMSEELQAFVEKIDATPNDVVFAFKHNAIAEIIYKLMLTAQRQRIHIDIAQWQLRRCVARLAEGLSVDDSVGQLAHHFKEGGDAAMAIICLQEAGRLAIRKGMYKEAERCLLSCKDLLEKSEKPDKSRLSRVLLGLADLYSRHQLSLRTKGCDDVTKLLLSALEIQQELHSETPSSKSQMQLARIYHSLSFHCEPCQRELYLRDAISVRKAADMPYEAAESLNALGQWHHEQSKKEADPEKKAKQMKDAYDCILEAIALRSDTKWSPDLAQSETSYASLLLTKSPAEAASVFRRALQLYCMSLGPFHSRSATALTGLAHAYRLMGDSYSTYSLLMRTKRIRADLGTKNPAYRKAESDVVEQRELLDRPWVLQQPTLLAANSNHSKNPAPNAERLPACRTPSCSPSAAAAARSCSVVEICQELIDDAEALDRVALRLELAAAYPELQYYCGLMKGSDLQLEPAEAVTENVFLAMELAVRIAAGQKMLHLSDNLLAFARTQAGLCTAEGLDFFLSLLAVSSLHLVANIVGDVQATHDGVTGSSAAAVLDSKKLWLPSLARQSTERRSVAMDIIRASVQMRLLCTAQYGPLHLKPLRQTAQNAGSAVAKQLLLHDLLRDLGPELSYAPPAGHEAGFAPRTWGTVAADRAVTHFGKLTEEACDMDEQAVYKAFVRCCLLPNTMDTEHHFAQARLACMLRCSATCPAAVTTAISHLPERERLEIERELSLDVRKSTDRPVVLHGASDLLLACQNGDAHGLSCVDDLTMALTTIAKLYRIVRDAMRDHGVTVEDAFDLNCYNLARVVTGWSMRDLAQVTISLRCMQLNGAYVVVEPPTCSELLIFQDRPFSTTIQEMVRSGASDRLALATYFPPDLTEQAELTETASVVIVAACALTQDAELALILSRALSDMRFVDVKAVVANVQPAQARAKLARGTMDALGMRHVRVAQGSDGNSTRQVDNFTASVARTGYDYLVRDVEEKSADSMLLDIYRQAPPSSLTLLLISPLTDAAQFMKAHEALFIAKTHKVVIQGGVDPRSFDSACKWLHLDPTCQNHQFDMEAAQYVYRKCQEWGIGLVIVSRFAVYASGVPSFIFDDLAAIGHPVALRLRETQIRSTTNLWTRCCLPAGHEQRLGLPGRCDRQWFEKVLCNGADLSNVSEETPIWPFVTRVSIYDPLSVLAAQPTALCRFFEVQIKVVKGVEHMVVGATQERHGVRDVNGLRSFLTNAFWYALSQSAGEARQHSRKCDV